LTQTGTNPTTFYISATNNRTADTTGTLTRTYVYDAAGNTEGYGLFALQELAGWETEKMVRRSAHLGA
jgi:hypothetical protein